MRGVGEGEQQQRQCETCVRLRAGHLQLAGRIVSNKNKGGGRTPTFVPKSIYNIVGAMRSPVLILIKPCLYTRNPSSPPQLHLSPVDRDRKWTCVMRVWPYGGNTFAGVVGNEHALMQQSGTRREQAATGGSYMAKCDWLRSLSADG